MLGQASSLRIAWWKAELSDAAHDNAILVGMYSAHGMWLVAGMLQDHDNILPPPGFRG